METMTVTLTGKVARNLRRAARLANADPETVLEEYFLFELHAYAEKAAYNDTPFDLVFAAEYPTEKAAIRAARTVTRLYRRWGRMMRPLNIREERDGLFRVEECARRDDRPRRSRC